MWGTQESRPDGRAIPPGQPHRAQTRRVQVTEHGVVPAPHPSGKSSLVQPERSPRQVMMAEPVVACTEQPVGRQGGGECPSPQSPQPLLRAGDVEHIRGIKDKAQRTQAKIEAVARVIYELAQQEQPVEAEWRSVEAPALPAPPPSQVPHAAALQQQAWQHQQQMAQRQVEQQHMMLQLKRQQQDVQQQQQHQQQQNQRVAPAIPTPATTHTPATVTLPPPPPAALVAAQHRTVSSPARDRHLRGIVRVPPPPPFQKMHAADYRRVVDLAYAAAKAHGLGPADYEQHMHEPEARDFSPQQAGKPAGGVRHASPAHPQTRQGQRGPARSPSPEQPHRQGGADKAARGGDSRERAYWKRFLREWERGAGDHILHAQ